MNGSPKLVTSGATRTLPTPGNGDNTITYFATDLAGNEELPIHTIRVKVDGVTPIATIIAGPWVKNGNLLKATGSTAGPSGIASVSFLACPVTCTTPTVPTAIAGSSNSFPDYGVAWSGSLPYG